MADNVSITPGAGETVAADDVGGAKYQVIKLGLGADGAVDMHLDSGQQTKANSLPVTLASDDTEVVAIGTTADAVVVTDAVGTLSSKLRGLVKWAFERMPASLGQQVAAASLPVVLASDTGFIKAEDAASANGDKGIPILTIRRDTAASGVGDNLDYQPLITDGFGRLHTRGERSSSATQSSYTVTTSAKTLCGASSTRLEITIFNAGTVRAYLGTTSGVTAGPTGTNFGYIDPGESWSSRFYSGAVYAITASGTTYLKKLDAGV